MCISLKRPNPYPHTTLPTSSPPAYHSAERDIPPLPHCPLMHSRIDSLGSEASTSPSNSSVQRAVECQSKKLSQQPPSIAPKHFRPHRTQSRYTNTLSMPPDSGPHRMWRSLYQSEYRCGKSDIPQLPHYP